MGKKKVVKKKVAEPGTDLVAVQKTVLMHTTANKAVAQGAETSVTKAVGVTIFPASVPLSKVRVRTHGTFNMGNYNSVQASVEIEEVTVASPEARAEKVAELSREALGYNAELAKQVAERLFKQTLALEGYKLDG